jgi:hypothetical protein
MRARVVPPTTERVPDAYVIPIISDVDPPDDSSLGARESEFESTHFALYRLREKKVKAPSVVSSTSSVTTDHTTKAPTTEAGATHHQLSILYTVRIYQKEI